MPGHATSWRQIHHFGIPFWLVVLLLVDAVFMILHVYNRLLPDPNILFLVDHDGGYSEYYQYLKEYWIAVALLAVFWLTKEKVYAVWGMLFLYLLLDDALQIHEAVGDAAARYWSDSGALGLRIQDFGELAVSAAVGGIFALAVLYYYHQGGNEIRRVSQNLGLMLVALAFFGIAIDLLYAVYFEQIRGLALLEDGGEMVIMSVLAYYALQLLRASAPRRALSITENPS